MKLLKQFIQQETVLTAAAVLAVVSAFFVPPDVQYLGYIDLRTLAILFSLMTVMAGLRRQGFFDGLGRALLSRTHSTFQLTLVLVGLCFFGSMFITNDVSLLTFVPFTFVVLSRLGADVRRSLLVLVVSKDCKYPQVAVEILNILYDDLARATAETAPDVIAYINAGGHNEGRPYYMEVLPSNNPSIYYTEHMAVINGEMTPEETTIAENRGSSQAILDYLKDPQNVTEKTLGGWHFYESRIIGLGASIEALEKNGNAEWITPKYPPTTPTSEQKKATLDKTELEAYVAIVTGAQPIDYFDTFVSEWKRLGGDAIAQEVQEYFAQ